MNLTMKSIKLQVTQACATDAGLAEAITNALGFRPRWSKLDIIGHMLVWLAYKTVCKQQAETWQPEYYDAFLALKQLQKLQLEPYSVENTPKELQ